MKHLVIPLVILLIACSNPTEIGYKKDAEVTILSNWVNEEITIIEFEIENTGNLDIDEWEVMFQVTTLNELFVPSRSGEDLLINEVSKERILIDTTDKIVSILVTGVSL